MARIVPDGWRELAVTGAAQREIETLARLAEGLPDDYTVYHAVHWTNIERGYAIFGEIDFAVVNRHGDLLLIEQKSGFLSETPEGLVKRYSGRTRSVAAQMARSRDALLGKLRQRPDCAAVAVDVLLYCPDYRVKTPLTAGLAPERIVDADQRERLTSAIRAILPAGDAAPAAKEVQRFLRDEIQLEPDVSALMGRARGLVTRVAGGLTHWARQIDMQPWRLRVTGTAGSGKTQLALTEFRAALARGERPLYVCFNRPLADHFGQIIEADTANTAATDAHHTTDRLSRRGGNVVTFHMLCEQLLRAHGQAPDFSAANAFERLISDAQAATIPDTLLYDTVIIDEGQDFSAAWRDQVLRHARPDARLLWLEDPLQNLYGNPAVELAGWVRLRADTNYRCPRPVVRLLHGLLPEAAEITAASPFDTDDVEILVYRDSESLMQQVKEAVRQCYSAGYRKSDVALLSYHGRDRSQLLRLEQLGPHSLKTFTGRYDLLGQPIYRPGELLTESVYRFKGQAAPAVILSEIDFATLDEKAARKLFVGATRAMMKLILVIQESAAQQLLARLDAADPL